ncbi:carbon-nitrogen family hydrolase [Streptomyces sp. NPDC048383]|uniref:carbon-nitrogen family hydrolase n=1 Tax=Streptomyces sp. NPDC048383 TaxID=3155386 RepID=UPI0034175BA1
MRASLIQIAVNDGESVASRRSRVAELVRDQSDSDLVVLPELWTVGAFAYEQFETEAEPLDGPTYESMADAARDAGVWLHAGSIVERAGDGSLYNTALTLSPKGELAATYRKIHRFGFDQGEAVLMSAGDSLTTVTLPEQTLGISTCYDLRFPELFRGLVDAGATTMVVAAGWPARRRSHWTLLNRARAVEDQAYVLGCALAGTHAGVEQSGHSLVVDPWGEVLAEAGPGEDVITVDLDPKKVAETREQFPALKDRALGVRAPGGAR